MCECRNVVNCQVLLKMGEQGHVDEFFLGIPNINWLTKYRTRTVTKKCYLLRTTSPFQVANERASEQQSLEGQRKWRALTSFPRPCYRVMFRLPLARDFSQRATVFIFVRDCCMVIIMADSIPSVPIPPKAFVKYWHLLWLSTSEQKWTKLLKLSSLAKKICLKDTLLAELLRSFC